MTLNKIHGKDTPNYPNEQLVPANTQYNKGQVYHITAFFFLCLFSNIGIKNAKSLTLFELVKLGTHLPEELDFDHRKTPGLNLA